MAVAYTILFLNHNLLMLSPLGILVSTYVLQLMGTGYIAMSIFVDVAFVCVGAWLKPVLVVKWLGSSPFSAIKYTMTLGKFLNILRLQFSHL